MSRFARRAPQAGLIEPRATNAADEQPRGHTAFARLVGGAGMIALTATLFWLLTDTSFRVTAGDVHLEGLRYADEAAVRARLGTLERSPNAFRVRASDIVARLASLPEIASAEAIVTLPASVSIRIQERQPIFAWSNAATEWLVDRDGRMFAPVAVSSATDPGQGGDTGLEGPATDPDAAATGADVTGTGPDDGTSQLPGTGPDDGTSQLPGSSPESGTSAGPTGEARTSDSAAGAAALRVGRNAFEAGLPRVDDWRTLRPAVSADGSHLSSIDLAVMRQLLALTPEDLGSPDASLALRVQDDLGYVLAGGTWRAVFGHYTPRLQGPAAVPRQVQCLRWLLADRRWRPASIRLAVSGDLCGTFTDYGAQARKPARSPRP